MECGVLRIIVGATAPHKIQQVSADLLDLFQLLPVHCMGRTLGVISGPGTNTGTLAELIDAAVVGKIKRAILMLYSRSGAGENFCITAQPYFAEFGELRGVLLACEPSCPAPSLKVAAQDDGLAKAVLEAEAPFRTVFCSPEFVQQYKLAELSVLGRSLNLIHGPSTDQRTWLQLLDSARRGIPGRAPIITATSDCSEIETVIDVKPVLSAGGFITHLVLTSSHVAPRRHRTPMPSMDEYKLVGACSEIQARHFSAQGLSPHNHGDLSNSVALAQSWTSVRSHPMPRQTSELLPTALVHSVFDCEPDAAECAQVDTQLLQAPQSAGHATAQAPANCSPVNADSMYPTLSTWHDQERTLQQGPLQAIDRTAREPSPPCMLTVVPRRKAGQGPADIAVPVSVTRETLQMYAGVRLTKAAELLGISTTAMKKACRKLGVSRWPYNPSAPSKPQSPIRASTAAKMVQVDSAYVRKVFRKYSRGSVRISDFSIESLKDSTCASNAEALQPSKPHRPSPPPSRACLGSEALAPPAVGEFELDSAGGDVDDLQRLTCASGR